MIVIAGSITIDLAKHDQAVAAALAMRTATLAEPGCQEYRFSFALDAPDVVLLFEEWDDEASLTAHFGQPHMATFQAAVAQVVAGPADFHRFEVSEKRPLR